MTNYQIGDIRTCKACGKQIRFVDPHWTHVGEYQPRHNGEPVELKLAATNKPTALPERAFVLEGKFQADSADDLAWLLRHFADAIDRKEVGVDGCWGSPSSGAVYRYKTNDDMTHDAYFTAVDEWQKGQKKSE